MKKQAHLMRWTIMHWFLCYVNQLIRQLKLFLREEMREFHMDRFLLFIQLFREQRHTAVSNFQARCAWQSSFDVQIKATLRFKNYCMYNLLFHRADIKLDSSFSSSISIITSGVCYRKCVPRRQKGAAHPQRSHCGPPHSVHALHLMSLFIFW